jgi:hypothetical protein
MSERCGFWADDGLSGSNAPSARLTHNKSNPASPRIRLLIAEDSLQDSLQVGLLMAASEKKGERYQPSLPAVHSLQSGLASKNRDKWAESAHLSENKGANSLRFRLNGGEGGIRTFGTGLKPPKPEVSVSCR